MKMLIFDDGDDCWIGMGRRELVKGKVLMRVNIPGYLHEHYIIEVQTGVDPVLEVRDGFTMSDAVNRPLGIWRKNDEQQHIRQDQKRGWWRRLFGH